VGVLTALAYGITFVLMTPYLVSAVKNPPESAIRDASQVSVDLLSFVVPRGSVLISPGFATDVSAHFLAHTIEDAGYVSVALLFLLVGFAITERRRKGTWGLLAFVAVVSIAALGPVLHVMGRPSVSLPWKLVEHAPLIQNATPDRFPAYSALAIAVIGALWLARAPSRTAVYRWGVVGLGAVLLFPNLGAIPHLPQTVPLFFSSGEYRNVLRADEVVFAIPKDKGEELTWQEATDYSIQLAQGHMGVLPDRYAHEPLSTGLNARSVAGVSPATLAAWLQERQVTAIVVADAAQQRFAPLIRSVGGASVYEGGGVSVWRSTQGVWTSDRTAP